MMTAQAKHNFRYPTCARVQAPQDFFLLSSFALSAAVLVFHTLMGS
jgi:hypothetical protein